MQLLRRLPHVLTVPLPAARGAITRRTRWSLICPVFLGTWLLGLGGAGPTVFAQGAALEATPPGAGPAGSTVTVRWTGPNGPGDFVTVVPKGAAPFQYLDYKPTSDG